MIFLTLAQRTKRIGLSPIVPRARSGFTLIEVLVVIGVIALIIAITLPALSHVRSSARQTQCLSNLRQLALLATQYISEHKRFPLTESLTDIDLGLVTQLKAFNDYAPGMPLPGIYRCPAALPGDDRVGGGPGRASLQLLGAGLLSATQEPLRTPQTDGEGIFDTRSLVGEYERDSREYGRLSLWIDLARFHVSRTEGDKIETTPSLVTSKRGFNASYFDGSAAPRK